MRECSLKDFGSNLTTEIKHRKKVQIKFGSRKKVATFAVPKQTGEKVGKAKAWKLGKKRSDSRRIGGDNLWKKRDERATRESMKTESLSNRKSGINI